MPNATEAIPRAWTKNTTPSGVVLSFVTRRSAGCIGASLLTAAILIFCGYQIIGFLQNWFVDRAEILPAGVVLFLILCGGVWFAIRNIRRIFSSTNYIFGTSQLEVREKYGKSNAPLFIEKNRVKKIIKLYTPAKEAALQETWRTCLVHADSDGKEREYFFEGNDKDECEFVTAALLQWKQVSVEKQNTAL